MPTPWPARFLDEEHQAYPEAIARVLSGRFQVVDWRYVEFAR
jgi:folate-dependent phosphoribosylglycinamide formyltransferase PurN